MRICDYILGENVNVNGEDGNIFKQLYSVAPPKKNSTDDIGSKGSGHGEVALYWLLSKNNDVQDNRKGGAADLLVNGFGVEVKAYDLAGNTDEAVANMSTEWGDIQDGPLLDNQVYIANIETKEEYQRRYLATGLLAFASQLTDKKILHSDKLTNMGYAFMSSVEMDESRKTIDYPSLAESQDDREKVMVIDITKLSKTKSSAEITDLLQRLNADQIPYKLKY